MVNTTFNSFQSVLFILGSDG